MLAFAGIIGFLQITILPGLILVKVLNIRGGLLERLIYLFPLSLICNYLLVFALTAAGIYTRTVLILLLVIEWLGMFYCWRHEIRLPIKKIVRGFLSRLESEILPLRTGNFFSGDFSAVASQWVWFLFGLAALSAALWTIHVWRLNIGTIFSGWDTLFSWNAYAETWAQNAFPSFEGFYPQLVSANWSVSYVLQGQGTVQFFNTLIPPLFFVWIFLMLFDLGFQKKETGFFIAAVIARYMMKKLMGDQMFNGYMDVPVACMVFQSLYALLKGNGRSSADQRQSIFLGVVFAAGACVTKQAGLITLILVPVAISYWLKDGIKSMRGKQLVLLLSAAALIVFPFYLFAFFANKSTEGTASSLIAGGILNFNQTYEWSHKWQLIRQSLGIYGYVFLLSLIGLPFIPKKYRLVFFLASWPIILFWGLLLPYDTRNLAVALPLVAVSCGFFVEVIIDGVIRLLGKTGFGSIPTGVLIGAVIIAVVLISWLFNPDEKLTSQQTELSRQLFGAGLNQELLFNILGDSHVGNDILTDYPAYFLPGYQNCCEMIDFKDDRVFQNRLADGSIHYLLIPQNVENLSWESYDVVNLCRDSGQCELIQCSSGYYIPYCLYAVNP